ncbi:MAG TPA: BolA family transcriptional regulator [Alcaligenaceae bacterium]|nr:BolA family transcriptional regulator [Alcaligenaceae bacterium]
MSISERIALVTERLRVLQPTHFEIIDESHLHAGHAGAQGGASHFRLIIGSDQFEGLSTLAKHRLIYEHVQDLIPHPIHAFAIEIK